MNTEIEDVIEVDVEKSNDFFANWFKQNPDKVLGEIKPIKTKFGKDAFTVIGDKDKLLSIDVPDYMQISNTDPLVSTENEIINETNVTPEDISNIQNSNKKSKEVESIIREIKKDKTVDNENLWSYEEVDEIYNGARYKDGVLISEEITLEEKQAYALYLHRLTGRYLDGGFAKYDMQDNMANIKGLMKAGTLCFDNTEKEERRRYKPTFYYASGNVQEKYKKLNEDKDFYIQNFGQDVFENHLKVLEKSLELIKEKKLTLTNPDKSKRINLNIYSEFAENFSVKPITPLDEKDLENQWNTWIRKNDDGEIEWKVKMLKSGYAPYERNGGFDAVFSTKKIPLKDAFAFWLYGLNGKNLSNYGIVLGSQVTNIDEIYTYYVRKLNSIPSKYKDDEGKVNPDWYEKRQAIILKGEELFSLFLEKYIQSSDRIAIELVWNQKYNSLLNFDSNRVPILFRFAKMIGNEINDIRPEKRDAISFNMLTGSSLLAYGVGLGKTFCAIFTIGQNLDLGICKRPLIVVPNSVYPQFVQEVRTILPQYEINGLYNLRGVHEAYANDVKDNTISIISYSGLDVLGFKDDENSLKLFKRVQKILEQVDVDDKQSEKKQAKINKALTQFLGMAQSNSSIFIDELKFDYVCVDEAHNFKNLIESVKSDDDKDSDDKKSRSSYKIKGSQSIRAVKLFAINSYVQINNYNGNCLLLTATPFTNSPLEIYSMLSLIRYETLVSNGFERIVDFFDTYADLKYEPEIGTNLKLEIVQVVKGFKNVVSLQGIIFSLIDKPSKITEEKAVIRPNKVVLPLWDKRVNDNVITVNESNQVTTLLRMTEFQKNLLERLYKYSNGSLTYEELSQVDDWNLTKCGSIESMKKKAEKDVKEGIEVDYNKNNVRSVFTLTYSRTIALNPYLYRFSAFKEEPTPAEYVQASPKIEYAIECIKTVKEHHEKTNTPMSGQIIYMSKGVSCFDLILEYLVEYLGFQWHEVGIIAGGEDSRIGKKKADKEDVQDAFLGRKLDFKDPKNPKYVNIPHEQRLKVIVGSGAIKEGVNLQFYSTCLYNCEIEYNPTDLTQLEGRIWRQKNAFANVRIVIPLLENSADAFVYGKLKTKTGRINQIWDRDGVNEFNLDELDSTEMQRATTRDVQFIADMNKRQKNKDYENSLSILVGEQSAFRNVRLISDEIFKVYNRIAYSLTDNPMQIVWNFLNFFRPSLITKPLINDKDLIFKPTEEERSMGLRINKSALNYTFEELDAVLKKFREDKIVEYPRGYNREWKGLFEKTYPKFEVGERVKFKTRRGENEGVIDEITMNNYENNLTLTPKIVYDINVNGVIIENITFENNEIQSLDNPIEEKTSVDLGGKELRLGLKESANDLLDVYKFTQNKLQKNLLDTDITSIEYIGYNNSTIVILGTFNSYYSSSDIIRDYIESLKTFPKFSDFYYQNFLKKSGYDLSWSRWIIDYKDYWNKNLIPKGILNEDMLTEKLTFLREKISEIESDIATLNSKDNYDKLIEEAKEEIRLREESGDKPLSPLECARVFAKPNPDYLGNKLLDEFTKSYIESQKPKKVEEKVEEKVEDIKLVEVKEPIIEVKERIFKVGDTVKDSDGKIFTVIRLLPFSKRFKTYEVVLASDNDKTKELIDSEDNLTLIDKPEKINEVIVQVKEPTIFDKKLKLLKLMLSSAKGSDKDLIEKKIRLLNLMNK